jgi:mRNA interferase MazF
MKRGEIYRLDFGIPQGSVQGGRRPALVIQSDAVAVVLQNDVGNRTSPTTIVAAITAQKKKSYPFHVEISSKESGLPQNSTILLEQIQTVSQNRLVKKLGELDEPKMYEVDEALMCSLGISLR